MPWPSAGSRGYDKVLLAYHEMEDSFLFPLYRGSHPEVADVVDQLEAQHHDLDECIAEIARRRHR